MASTRRLAALGAGSTSRKSHLRNQREKSPAQPIAGRAASTERSEDAAPVETTPSGRPVASTRRLATLGAGSTSRKSHLRNPCWSSSADRAKRGRRARRDHSSGRPVASTRRLATLGAGSTSREKSPAQPAEKSPAQPLLVEQRRPREARTPRPSRPPGDPKAVASTRRLATLGAGSTSRKSHQLNQQKKSPAQPAEWSGGDRRRGRQPGGETQRHGHDRQFDDRGTDGSRLTAAVPLHGR
ncbi:Uncharacterised protein [Clostridioides difficile]|nr:Uncharacterised protein [Clostridioides difficile]